MSLLATLREDGHNHMAGVRLFVTLRGNSGRIFQTENLTHHYYVSQDVTSDTEIRVAVFHAIWVFIA